MRTFASVAVLGMMLAGTALAQSGTGTQRSEEIVPGGAAALERGQSEVQKVMPGASGSIGSRSDTSGGTVSEQQATTGSASATGGSSMSDQQAASGTYGSGRSSTTMGTGDTGGSGGSAGMTGSTRGDGSAARMGGNSGYGMDQGSQSQALAGDWDKNPNIVRQVQTQLQQDGYDVGGVDGIYGPKTRQALQSFQRDKGQPVTGQIDQNLLAEMNIDTGSQTATVPGSRMQQPSGQSR